MLLTIRRTAVAFAALAIAGSAALVVSPAAGASTTPPWEPDGSSVGGLVFFDSAGHPITGGNVTDQPVAAYVEGTAAPHAGDTKATLFAFTPVSGQLPTQWSGEQLGGSTAYPNSAAPAPLKTATLPVESGGSGDESIAQYVSDFPNTDTSTTDGYGGMYQLRLYTSGTSGGSSKYDSADIQVTGSTWSVVYTVGAATKTSTTLAVSPSKSAFHGAAVKLTATVTPAAAAGSVQFRSGATLLKTVAVSGGKASLSTKTLKDGVHKLTAKFVPTDSNAYSGSTSAAHSLTVKAHATTVTVKPSASSIKQGKKLTLTIKETPAVAGKVAIYDGSKKIGTVAVKKGKATFSTTKLAVGSHSLKAKFTPSNTQNDAVSTSKTVKVKVTK